METDLEHRPLARAFRSRLLRHLGSGNFDPRPASPRTLSPLGWRDLDEPLGNRNQPMIQRNEGGHSRPLQTPGPRIPASIRPRAQGWNRAEGRVARGVVRVWVVVLLGLGLVGTAAANGSACPWKAAGGFASFRRARLGERWFVRSLEGAETMDLPGLGPRGFAGCQWIRRRSPIQGRFPTPAFPG